MCRLFGMSGGSRPIGATFWLLEAPDSLAVQSERNPDGTGIGYFDPDGAPRVDKQPLEAERDPAFARAAREVESTTFVAHVRFASTGGLTVQNTHPFEQRRRLFAHNGVIEGLPELESRLGSARSLVQGETDSERFFALITSEIDGRGDVAQGIQAASHWVAENLPVFAMNFVLSTATDLWALRYPDAHGLFVLERRAGGPEGGENLEHSSHLGMRVRSAAAQERAVVVVASEAMDSDPGWRELRSGELLHVPATLEVESKVVLEGPPAHPLTLADLHPSAAQSRREPGLRPGG
jgi:glutamine amidotransferase